MYAKLAISCIVWRLLGLTLNNSEIKPLGIYILGHFKRLKLKNFPSRPTMVTDILKYLLDPRIFFIFTGLLRLVRLVTVRILLGDFVSGATYSSLS